VTELLEVAPEEWDGLLERRGLCDVYFRRAYLESAELLGQGRPVYDDSILKAREGAGERGDDEDDPVYDQAVDLVSRMEEVSVSKLQREMRLGYNKAAKIVERMEREGIVGPANGVKPRQVLIRPAGETSPVPNV